MRAEIEALVADRSSTSDSECGIAYIGACGGDYVVYSRTTVDENVLLEKVRQYNDLDEFLGRQFHLLCLAYEPIPLEARSENGVCVAVTPGAESGS